jgi:hypothetical protein
VLARAIERFEQYCFQPIRVLISFTNTFLNRTVTSNTTFVTCSHDFNLRPEILVQFFVNFLIWCVAFTAYILATLLPIVVITGNRTVAGGDLIDGQVVGVMGTYVFRSYPSLPLFVLHLGFLHAHASYIP